LIRRKAHGLVAFLAEIATDVSFDLERPFYKFFPAGNLPCALVLDFKFCHLVLFPTQANPADFAGGPTLTLQRRSIEPGNP